MPILDTLPVEQVAEGTLKGTLEGIQKKRGFVPAIWATMAHAPAVASASLAMNSAIGHDLAPKLRELAYLQCSRINHCHYCDHYHKAGAKAVGLSEAQIAAENLAKFIERSEYDETEKLVLRFADEWTRQAKVSDEVMQALKAKLTPAALVTLAATCAMANWTNKFNESFGTVLP